jgi:hypothetical protein
MSAKRVGRPPIDAEQRKSFNMTFRARAGLRERLAEAAEQSGRSTSEEIELRLEQSFELQQRVRGLERHADIDRVTIERLSRLLLEARSQPGDKGGQGFSAAGSMSVGEVTVFAGDEADKPQAPQKTEDEP